MPLAARLPCALGTRHAYASIPEEDDDDLSDVMDYAPRPEAGWWKGAWPVGVSLLLFTAAFVGSGVASHKASTTQHPINTHIRVQDRAAMRMHAQTPALPKATQASAAAPLASTSDEDSSCVASSTFSFTVSECSCDATKVVLAGADPVAYFSMSEGDAYVVGSSEYSSTLNGYTFYFSSSENKALFEASPWKYSPSWGGFCAWGMAEEREPSYNWEPSNLGPSVDLTLWLVRNDRLFLFYKSEAMEKFLVDPDQFELDGDERWVAWYGAKEQSPFNTDCYVQLEIEGETAISEKVQGLGQGKEEGGSESKGSEKVEEGKEEGGDKGIEMGGGEAVGTQKGKEGEAVSEDSTTKQEGGEKEVQSEKTGQGVEKGVNSEKTEEGGEKEATTEKTGEGEKGVDSEKADAKQETGSSKSKEEGKEEGGKTVSKSKKSTHKGLKGKSTHKVVKGSSEKAVKGGKSRKEAGK